MANSTSPTNHIDTGIGSVAGVRQPKPSRFATREGFGLSTSSNIK